MNNDDPELDSFIRCEKEFTKLIISCTDPTRSIHLKIEQKRHQQQRNMVVVGRRVR
jgi:hypothetical protein